MTQPHTIIQGEALLAILTRPTVQACVRNPSLLERHRLLLPMARNEDTCVFQLHHTWGVYIYCDILKLRALKMNPVSGSAVTSVQATLHQKSPLTEPPTQRVTRCLTFECILHTNLHANLK